MRKATTETMRRFLTSGLTPFAGALVAAAPAIAAPVKADRGEVRVCVRCGGEGAFALAADLLTISYLSP